MDQLIESMSNLNINYRTKPCNYLIYEEPFGIVRECRKENCSFAHSLEELRVKVCFAECNDYNCQYKHSYENNFSYFTRRGIEIPKLPFKNKETWKEITNQKLDEIEKEISKISEIKEEKEIEKEIEKETFLILSLCKSTILSFQNKKEINNITIINKSGDLEKNKKIQDILEKCGLYIKIK
jgi:hypothetical protein